MRYEPEGLVFQGRADDQVKLGGRRIELGEVDAALQGLDGVAGGAAVVQRTPAGNQVLVGYVAPVAGATIDTAAANDRLRQELPAALVPLLAVVDALPTRTSGKVDRAALPWPLPGATETALLPDTVAWIAERWAAILGVPVTSVDDDFFAHGGGSLTAAQLVSAIRERFPTTTVADVYDHPRIGALAEALDDAGPVAAARRPVRPVPPATGLLLTVLGLPVQVLRGLRVTTWTALASSVLHATAFPALPSLPWWALVLALALFVTPVGKMALTVVLARLVLLGVRPGDHPRGGSVHVRVWLAERIAEAVDGPSTSGAPWISYYARALGARIGQGVDLHTLPPVTGMLTIGKHASIEPEVDLAGHWVDGDVFRLGRVRVDADAVVHSRSTLMPGAHVGAGAEVEAGSAVSGRVPDGERWAGSPAERVGSARHGREARPPSRRRWLVAYGVGSVVVAGLPVVGVAAGVTVAAGLVGRADTIGSAVLHGLAAVPLTTLVAGAVYAGLVVVAVRLLGIGLREGRYPVRSRTGWQAWCTERVLDAARTLLFPLYASLVTPLWLRVLGARVGRDTEISTVLLIPALTQIASGAFLADDTMVATYELGGGYVRIGRSKVGRRAFLGNSGMTGAGRSVPREALVAVLSAVPKKAKRGSSWLGSPPVRLRRATTEFDEERTFRPPRRLKVARGLWELLRLVARWCPPRSRSASRGRCSRCGPRSGSSGPSCSRVRSSSSRAPSPPRCRRPRSGSSSGGSTPGNGRCGRRSCGATRCRTRSSRPSPGPGSRSRPRGRRPWPRGSGASEPGSAAAPGSRRTGCRRPTSSRSAPVRPSRAGPSCRPTCSTTGSCSSTRSAWTPARPSARTASSCRRRASAPARPSVRRRS